MKKISVFFWVTVMVISVQGQLVTLSGIVKAGNNPLPLVSIRLAGEGIGTTSDSAGRYFMQHIPAGHHLLEATSIGYENYSKRVFVKDEENATVNIVMNPISVSLSEVFVTNVSRATLIRESAVAVTSVSVKQIAQTSASNIIDVLVKNVPGLNAVKTGANISKPFIRGLGYNRVLTLYDGIRQEGQQWGDEHGIEVDAYNIDRAEVIKGPASLMYGSDALAGVVSLFPFVPDNSDGKWHVKFTDEYQANNHLVGDGLQLHYNNEHFLMALRGSVRMATNYRNAVDGRVYLTGFNEKNMSALLGYKTAKGYTHFNLTLYDNRQGIPDGSRDSASRKFTQQIYEGDKDTLKNRPIVPESDLNAYRVPALSQHIQHYRMYAHSFYKTGKGDIDFLLGAQQNIRREYNHPSMPDQAGMYVRLNTLNYGIRYNVPQWANIETSFGLNGMIQSNKSLQATDFPIPDYHLLDAGAYVHGKWKYDKWTISLGGRYDLRQLHWDDFYTRQNNATGFDGHVSLPDTANAILQFSGYTKAFCGISGSLGFTFQASKIVSFKANIGRAYRAPNITEMASNGLDPGAHIIYLGNRAFAPEFSLQEDIGISVRTRNFSVEASLFNNNLQNYIYLQLVTAANGEAIIDAQGNKTYQYQQAAAQLYGGECWWSFHPANITGFRWDNSIALVYGFNKKAEYKNTGTQGEYLPLIPPAQIRSSISQAIKRVSKWLNLMTPKFEMEFSAAQNRYLALNNTETGTPAYALFNAGIVTELRFAKWPLLQIQWQVNNLFDLAYQSNLSRLKYFEYYSQSPNGRLGIYDMGRNACLKVTMSF